MREQVIQLAESAGVDPDDLLEYWSERAAIREIDGGQSRADAERGALDDMRDLIAAGTWMLDGHEAGRQDAGRKGPKSAGQSPSVKRSRASHE